MVADQGAALAVSSSGGIWGDLPGTHVRPHPWCPRRLALWLLDAPAAR